MGLFKSAGSRLIVAVVGGAGDLGKPGLPKILKQWAAVARGIGGNNLEERRCGSGWHDAEAKELILPGAHEAKDFSAHKSSSRRPQPDRYLAAIRGQLRWERHLAAAR